MNFKKDKVFTALIAVFAVIFLAGAGFCVSGLIKNSQSRTTIEKSNAALKKLCNQQSKPALTKENVEIFEANKKEINRATERKVGLLKGRGAAELAPKFDGDEGAFTSSLLGSVNDRAKKLFGDKIALGEDAKFFGFSRYLQSGSAKPSAAALPLLAQEQKIVQALTDALVAARGKAQDKMRSEGLIPADKHVFLYIKDVRREAGELPQKEGAPTSALKKDELVVLPTDVSAETGLCRIVVAGNSRGNAFPSLRRPDVVNAAAFQIGFIAPTSVLRNFIAEFSENGKYPIYVRDVSVSPATQADIAAAKMQIDPQQPETAPSAEAAADAGFGAFDIFGGGNASASADQSAAPAAPAVPAKISVQPETLSEFLVTLEYIAPIEKKSAPAAEEKEEE